MPIETMARGLNQYRTGLGARENANVRGQIKSESLYETQSREAAARLAKRVGTDLKQTASKVAQQAGYASVTEAMGDWLQDKSQERTLFRDFLMKKVSDRLGPGAAIPNSLTEENLGQEAMKGRIIELTPKERQIAGFGAAEEGKALPADYKKPSISGRIDGNAFSVMGAVSKALKNAGYKDLANDYMKEAMSGDYDNLLRASMKYVNFKF